MNNTFESQLLDSAKRQKTSTRDTIQLISNPKKNTFSIAWISTPVAMVVGILLGIIVTINIQKESNFSTDVVGTMICDTVYVEADCDYEWLSKSGDAWCIMLPEVCCKSNRR